MHFFKRNKKTICMSLAVIGVALLLPDIANAVDGGMAANPEQTQGKFKSILTWCISLLKGELGQLAFLVVCGYKFIQNLMKDEFMKAGGSVILYLIYQGLLDDGMRFFGGA